MHNFAPHVLFFAQIEVHGILLSIPTLMYFQ
jgi:hypothetical protein